MSLITWLKFSMLIKPSELRPGDMVLLSSFSASYGLRYVLRFFTANFPIAMLEEAMTQSRRDNNQANLPRCLFGIVLSNTGQRVFYMANDLSINDDLITIRGTLKVNVLNR